VSPSRRAPFSLLAKGALGPLSGFAWPMPQGGLPGPWVEVTGPLAPCARGVHVCRSVNLAHWIHDELWEYLGVSGDRLVKVLGDLEVIARTRMIRVCCLDLPLPPCPWLSLESPPAGDLAIYRSPLLGQV
jgi:hypothetical protein